MIMGLLLLVILLAIFSMTSTKQSTSTKKHNPMCRCRMCGTKMPVEEWLEQDFVCTNTECEMSKRRRQGRKRNKQNKGAAAALLTTVSSTVDKPKMYKVPEHYEMDLREDWVMVYHFEGKPKTELLGEKPKIGIGLCIPNAYKKEIHLNA